MTGGWGGVCVSGGPERVESECKIVIYNIGRAQRCIGKAQMNIRNIDRAWALPGLEKTTRVRHATNNSNDSQMRKISSIPLPFPLFNFAAIDFYPGTSNLFFGHCYPQPGTSPQPVRPSDSAY